MITSTLATIGVLLASPAPPAASGSLLAVRVGRAETITQGTLEHAVILVEGGKIVEVGEDLPIERGIPVLDRPDWVVTPGLVNCYSRAGMDSRAGTAFEPDAMAASELYARQEIYRALLEAGVTTLGLYPAGSGIPGQAVAVKPRGTSAEEMTLADGVYLKVVLESSSSSKRMLRKGFADLDKYDEKVAKAREKWEKEQEKKSKKKKSKKDDDKASADDDKGSRSSSRKKDDGAFVPPEPDAKVKPFQALREGTLHALMRIQKAGDYLHLLDVIEDEEIDWALRVRLRDDIDLFEVKDKIGERGLRVVLEPVITLEPNTRRERNLPAELARAGAHVALIPRQDTVRGHEQWLQDVGLIVAAGMERDAALAAVTLEPAHVLGLEDRLGSLDKGKDANLVFWSADPLEPVARVEAVMLDGEFVYERDER